MLHLILKVSLHISYTTETSLHICNQLIAMLRSLLAC